MAGGGIDALEVRRATPDDADSLLRLKRALDRETRFMLLEPDERTETAADLAEHLRAVTARANSVVLVAVAGDGLAGYVEAGGGEFRRNRHSAYVVIGVRQAHAGRGVGRALLSELERWARTSGIRRLELTVMAHNERAVALYRRLGYEVEGTRRAALLVDGAVVDELWMARLV